MHKPSLTVSQRQQQRLPQHVPRWHQTRPLKMPKPRQPHPQCQNMDSRLTTRPCSHLRPRKSPLRCACSRRGALASSHTPPIAMYTCHALPPAGMIRGHSDMCTPVLSLELRSHASCSAVMQYPSRHVLRILIHSTGRAICACPATLHACWLTHAVNHFVA